MREVGKGGGGQKYWGKRRRDVIRREGTEKGKGKKWRKKRARERERQRMWGMINTKGEERQEER